MEKMAELGKSMLTSDVEFRQIRTTLVELNQELKKINERINNLSEHVVKLVLSQDYFDG
jgi:vacuolar-type H+-ATPase subunit D/Vma8